MRNPFKKEREPEKTLMQEQRELLNLLNARLMPKPKPKTPTYSEGLEERLDALGKKLSGR